MARPFHGLARGQGAQHVQTKTQPVRRLGLQGLEGLHALRAQQAVDVDKFGGYLLVAVEHVDRRTQTLVVGCGVDACHFPVGGLGGKLALYCRGVAAIDGDNAQMPLLDERRGGYACAQAHFVD